MLLGAVSATVTVSGGDDCETVSVSCKPLAADSSPGTALALSGTVVAALAVSWSSFLLQQTWTILSWTATGQRQIILLGVWTTCPESWHELESNLQLLSSTQYAPTAYNNKLTLKKRTVNANLHTGARDDKNLVYKLDRKVFNKRLDKNQQDWCWSIAQCIFNTSWTMDQGLRISNKQNHSPVRCWVFDFLCLRVCCFLLSFLTWTYKAQSFIFQKH